MSKNKDNVPKIRFPGFTEAWEQRKLGVISKLGSSKRVHREDYAETGIPFFRGLEISKLGSSSKLEDVLYITEEYYKDLKDKYGVPQIGDILITAVGTLGNPYLINDNLPFYFKDGNLIWLRDIQINPQYLNIYLGDGIGKKRVLESAAGSNQKALTMAELQNVEIFFPYKEEQSKIGNLFTDLDNLITLHQRKLNNVKKLKVGLLQKMFPKNGEKFPEIRFSGFTEAWEQRKLEDMGDTLTGLSGKTKEDFGHGKGRYITYMNVFTNTISNPKMVEPIEIDDKQTQVKFGDVFFTTSSETPEEVGMSSVWLENTENVYLNSFCFGYRPTVEFDLYYLAFMLRSPLIREKLLFLAQGISRYNISKNKVMDIKVPVPIIDEQRKIGIVFRGIDSLITLHQRKLENLQKLKKSLLQQMFV